MEKIANNIKKILYVNGGVDFAPIDVFDTATEYIYVDTMPRAEKDGYYIKSRFYRGHFVDQVVMNLMNRGFVLTSIVVLNPDYTWKIASLRQKIKHSIGRILQIPSLELAQVNPTKYTFVNRGFGKKVVYYMNTNVKYNMTVELRDHIQSCDTVVISSSVPNSILLNYFYNTKNFVTKESGFWFVDGSDKNSKHILSTIKKEGGDTYFHKYLFFDDDWEFCKCFDNYCDIYI